MTTYLTGIPSHEIDEIWDACVPYLDLVEKKGQGEMVTEDIYKLCKEAKMQLWVIYQ